jgi:hypothetical protein
LERIRFVIQAKHTALVGRIVPSESLVPTS